MNKFEYGNTLRVDANEDITTDTLILTLTSLKPPTAKELTIIAPDLVIGGATVVIDDHTYTAGEYVEYVFKEGDMSIDGTWRARLFRQNAGGTRCEITDYNALLYVVDP